MSLDLVGRTGTSIFSRDQFRRDRGFPSARDRFGGERDFNFFTRPRDRPETREITRYKTRDKNSENCPAKSYTGHEIASMKDNPLLRTGCKVQNMIPVSIL